MTTLMVVMQFLGQSVGLLVYRYSGEGAERTDTFRMPLFPIPCILQIVIFGFIFVTTDSYVLWGSETPTVEMALAFLAVGFAAFVFRAYRNLTWPFEEQSFEVESLLGGSED